MTDRTLCPVVIPVIGHSFVFQHVGIICKLRAPVHKKSHKLREGKLEHFPWVLVGLRVILVPDPGDVSVLTVHELIQHGGEDVGDVLVLSGALHLAVPHSLPGQTSLLAYVWPALSDELVRVTPVLNQSGSDSCFALQSGWLLNNVTITIISQSGAQCSQSAGGQAVKGSGTQLRAEVNLEPGTDLDKHPVGADQSLQGMSDYYCFFGHGHPRLPVHRPQPLHSRGVELLQLPREVSPGVRSNLVRDTDSDGRVSR